MRLIKYCSNIYMKKKRTISKNRSSYKKKIKRSKSKRKKRTKTKSRTKTIETTELMKWIQGKTKKKTRKKTRKKSKKKSKTYRKRVKRGGAAPTPANSPRRRDEEEEEALGEEELRQPEVIDEGLGSIEEGQEGQQGQQAQEEVEGEEEYEDEGGEPLPYYIPPVEEPVEVRQPEVAAEGLELVEEEQQAQQPGVPPPPSYPPPPPPVEGDQPVEVEEPVEVRDPFRPGDAVTREPYVGSQTAAARAIAEAEAQAQADEGEEDEQEDDQPPPVPPRPEEDVSQVEPITQRTPEEEEEEEEDGEEKSLWAKLKTFVKGTEYEQFIQEMGQELKELFTEYLNGYFEDLENGEDVDFLRAKYETFIDAYYKKAIAKDRALIEKLKGEEEGEE